MARALFKHWSSMVDNQGSWEQHFEAAVAQSGRSAVFESFVVIGENDSPSSIKNAVASKIREIVPAEWGPEYTVENNQIIWPDGSRS